MQSYTKNLYNSSVISKLKQEYSYNNDMQIPSIKSVHLSTAFDAKDSDSKLISVLSSVLTDISGQKAVICHAKKSVAGFKLRSGMPIGCKVTLRKEVMYNFLDKLLYIALPRIRDFKGLGHKSFNMNGHYNFGVRDSSIFPEIDPISLQKIIGFNVSITFSSKDVRQNLSLLKHLNFPVKGDFSN